MTDWTIRLVKSLSAVGTLSFLFFLSCLFILKDAFTVQKYGFMMAYLSFSTLVVLAIARKLLRGKQLFTYGWQTFFTVTVSLTVVEFLAYLILGLASKFDLLVALMIYFETVMILFTLIINGVEIVYPWHRWQKK
jgi:hypothetical protein